MIGIVNVYKGANAVKTFRWLFWTRKRHVSHDRVCGLGTNAKKNASGGERGILGRSRESMMGFPADEFSENTQEAWNSDPRRPSRGLGADSHWSSVFLAPHVSSVVQQDAIPAIRQQGSFM